MMNTTAEHQIPTLLALAHDKTEEGRILLAEKLAALFLSESSHLSAHEEKLVSDLINELLAHENISVRQKLVNSFTQAIDAPRDIAMKVAVGPIDIAAPMLMKNINLADSDLIVVIDKKERTYAEAIAQREKISEVVADALVATGDLRIMQIVAENMGAQLSGKAIESLIHASRLASMLQKPILSRPEIQGEAAIQLFWWLSHDLRRATMERFGFGPGKLDAALKKAIDERLSLYSLQKDDDAMMQDMALWLEDRGVLTPSILTQLLRSSHYRLFNIALSRMAKLDLELVDAITSTSGGRGMIALCRALNIDKGSFISIFLMSRGARPDEQIVHPKELSHALAAYDKLTPNKAQDILNSWRAMPDSLLLSTDGLNTQADAV